MQHVLKATVKKYILIMKIPKQDCQKPWKVMQNYSMREA